MVQLKKKTDKHKKPSQSTNKASFSLKKFSLKVQHQQNSFNTNWWGAGVPMFAYWMGKDTPHLKTEEQVSLAFWKFTSCHLAFMKDLH